MNTHQEAAMVVMVHTISHYVMYLYIYGEKSAQVPVKVVKCEEKFTNV